MVAFEKDIKKPGRHAGSPGGPYDRDSAGARLPTLSVTYRIEMAYAPDENPRQGAAPPRRGGV